MPNKSAPFGQLHHFFKFSSKKKTKSKPTTQQKNRTRWFTCLALPVTWMGTLKMLPEKLWILKIWRAHTVESWELKLWLWNFTGSYNITNHSEIKIPLMTGTCKMTTKTDNSHFSLQFRIGCIVIKHTTSSSCTDSLSAYVFIYIHIHHIFTHSYTQTQKLTKLTQ